MTRKASPKNPGERNRDKNKRDLGNSGYSPSGGSKKNRSGRKKKENSDDVSVPSTEIEEGGPSEDSPFSESVWTTERFDASTHVDKMTRTESLAQERAVLVGVYPPRADLPVNPLDELRGLAVAAGVKPVAQLTQRRDTPDFATCVGKGKVEELALLIEANEANVILFDNDLTPGQTRNLEKTLEIKVIDRTELILDIFASRAQTHEARLAVELAQLEYSMPRLKRMWTHLERQAGGGVGLRGPGEKQLEVDRRIAQKRIGALKKELDEIHARKQRQVSGRKWSRNVCLVGYTNAGKSTLLNRMTNSDVFVKDLLFATLDTRTKRWYLPSWGPVLLSDTVGFIRDLPHHLIASFRATLEEAASADLLIHVADAGNPEVVSQIKNASKVLESLGIDEKDTLLVLNKIDTLPVEKREALRERYPLAILISAHDGEGLDQLTHAVSELLSREFLRFEIEAPIADGQLAAFLAKEGEIFSRRYDDKTQKAIFRCRLPKHCVGKIAQRADLVIRPLEGELTDAERQVAENGGAPVELPSD